MPSEPTTPSQTTASVSQPTPIPERPTMYAQVWYAGPHDSAYPWSFSFLGARDAPPEIAPGRILVTIPGSASPAKPTPPEPPESPPQPTPEIGKVGEVILSIGDGPDGVRFYTDPSKAIVYGASPASLFVELSTFSSSSTFGPMLPGVAAALRSALSAKQEEIERLRKELVEMFTGKQVVDAMMDVFATMPGWDHPGDTHFAARKVIDALNK